MRNLCTKVTVRKRPLKNGKTSLYLDFYPPIRNPKTGKLSRREYLGFYIYTKPTEEFQHEYNRSMLQKAELVRCRRTEAIINEEFGFLDRNKGQESFLDYFKSRVDASSNKVNWQPAYKHFVRYTKGQCRFCDLDVAYCQRFLDFLLSSDYARNGKKMMATTANNHFNKLQATLRMAYEDGLMKENIAKKLVRAKGRCNKREYLTREELVRLSKAKCKSDVLRRAGLFSCLTGLRLSDCILLQWENIKKADDGGWVLDITTKKTKTAAILPISEEALALCGERGVGQVFKKLTPGVVTVNLQEWISAAGITKKISFHCFRHTFATLQLAGGTDIYTVSKLLTHSNLATTQVYAEVIDEKKRDAIGRITLRDDASHAIGSYRQQENSITITQLHKAVGELMTKVDYVINHLNHLRLRP